MGKLFLLFTVVPLCELYLLLRIGEWLGGLATVTLVLVTGMLGAAMARLEGLRVFRSWQDALRVGRLPEDGVVSGVLVLVGGVLLVTPGVLTDAVGLLLLLPPTRRLIATHIVRRLERAIADGTVQVIRGPGMGPSVQGWPPGPAPRGNVIEAEGETVDEASTRSDDDPRGP